MPKAAYDHSDLLSLIKRPIITEKSTQLAQIGQYVFEVDQNANKIQLALAVEALFPGRKVTDVRLIKIPARTKRFAKRIGKISEKRKAVFSVQGEPIELFLGV